MLPVEDRFWARVAKGDGCWLWTGNVNIRGYGVASLGAGRRPLAHRVAYEWTYGSIPENKEIHHICGNKACVRPDHLVALTRLEHVHRTPQSPACRNWQKTHCKRGHLLSDENIWVCFQRGRPQRHCRECHRIRARRHTEATQ